MTKEEKATALSTLELEIAAVGRSLSVQPFGLDDFGDGKFDIREHYLRKLQAAHRGLTAVKTEG